MFLHVLFALVPTKINRQTGAPSPHGAKPLRWVNLLAAAHSGDLVPSVYSSRVFFAVV